MKGPGQLNPHFSAVLKYYQLILLHFRTGGRFAFQVYFQKYFELRQGGMIFIAIEVKVTFDCRSSLLHIFSYLKSHHNTEMVFDPSDPMVDMTDFQEKDWSTSVFGDELKEIIPSNIPEPRGQGMITRCFVDADHASDTITRKSRTGFIVYVNMALIFWFSKKQTTVETSSFGSELDD